MRRFLSHLLLGIGVVVSLATSTASAPLPSAEVNSGRVGVYDLVLADRAPVLLRLDVTPEGAFRTGGGAELEPEMKVLVRFADPEGWSAVEGGSVQLLTGEEGSCSGTGGGLNYTVPADGEVGVGVPYETELGGLGAEDQLVLVEVTGDAVYEGTVSVQVVVSVQGEEGETIDASTADVELEAEVAPLPCRVEPEGLEDTGDTAL